MADDRKRQFLNAPSVCGKPDPKTLKKRRALLIVIASIRTDLPALYAL